MVIYARESKVANKPCLHEEWRMIGANTVKRKAGLIKIEDIASFMDSDIGQWFEEQYRQYIKYEIINHDRHGRFLQNMPRGRKKLPQYPENIFKPVSRFEMVSRMFCHIHKIKTAAELRNYYKNERIRIKTKGRGRTSIEDNKLLSQLSSYKLNSFFLTCDPPERL